MEDEISQPISPKGISQRGDEAKEKHTRWDKFWIRISTVAPVSEGLSEVEPENDSVRPERTDLPPGQESGKWYKEGVKGKRKRNRCIM